MGRLLFKRFIKYCMENVFLFAALLILVTAVVTVVLSLECTAYTVLDGRSGAEKYENIEDGEFTTLFELSDSEIEDLTEEHDVKIQKMYSMDIKTKGTTYRVFADRPEINRLSLNEGHAPYKDNDIAVEQIFALKNDIHLNDEIVLKGDSYCVVGIGSVPDYLHPTKSRADVGIMPQKFTWAIMTEDAFDDITEENPEEMVEYSYAYTKGDTDEAELEDSIADCIAFITREDNKRMDVEVKYAELYRLLGFLIGSLLVAMLAFIFAVVTKNQIHNEHIEIGSLYALGVSKGIIMLFYIMPTLIITLIAGILGIIVGFMPEFVNVAIEAFHRTNSFPYYEYSKPLVLYCYAIVMPPLVSLIVNYLSLNKTLSSSALSLIRDNYEKKKVRKTKVRLKNFISNFQLHRVFEDRSSIMIFFGVLVSIMLFMLGTNTHYLVVNNYENAKANSNYNYMCVMKNPVSDLDTEGEKIYIEEVKAQKYGTNVNFSIVGIEKENRFYEFDLDNVDSGEAIAGEALSTKLGIEIGDELIFKKGVSRTEHKVKIVDIVESNSSLELYMNINDLRKEFEQEDDYYTALLFEEEPDVDKDYIYSTIEKEEMLDSFGVMEDTMMPFMRLSYISSLLIFVSIMFLIVSTMIDRSIPGISLTKLLGFKYWEIQRMYISPVIYATTGALIFAIPSAKVISDAICPWIYKDLQMGMFFDIPCHIYALIFLGAIFIFIIILLVLIVKVNRISVNEILKNRE